MITNWVINVLGWLHENLRNWLVILSAIKLLLSKLNEFALRLLKKVTQIVELSAHFKIPFTERKLTNTCVDLIFQTQTKGCYSEAHTKLNHLLKQ